MIFICHSIRPKLKTAIAGPFVIFQAAESVKLLLIFQDCILEISYRNFKNTVFPNQVFCPFPCIYTHDIMQCLRYRFLKQFQKIRWLSCQKVFQFLISITIEEDRSIIMIIDFRVNSKEISKSHCINMAIDYLFVFNLKDRGLNFTADHICWMLIKCKIVRTKFCIRQDICSRMSCTTRTACALNIICRTWRNISHVNCFQ